MNSFKKIIAMIILAAFFYIGIAAVDKPVYNEFKNLQVLPKNIKPDSLDKIMNNFNVSLGVDCNYCHTYNKDLYKMEFEKDTRSEKEITRNMMRMTMDINNNYFQFNEEMTAAQVQAVTCYTCHKGTQIPSKEKKVEIKSPLNFKSN